MLKNNCFFFIVKINKNILAYQDDYNSAYNHDVWLEIATHPLLWQYSSFLLRILSALSNDKSAILCGHKNNDNLKQEITSNLTYPSWGWLHLNPVNKIIPTRRKWYMQIFSNILRIQFLRYCVKSRISMFKRFLFNANYISFDTWYS